MSDTVNEVGPSRTTDESTPEHEEQLTVEMLLDVRGQAAAPPCFYCPAL